MSALAGLSLYLVAPVLFGILGGEFMTPRYCWTPLRGVGAWRNARVAGKSLRLLHRMSFACAPELCTPECWQ